MAQERLVAVSYPVDDEYIAINTEVLGGVAQLSFLGGLPQPDQVGALRQADALIGWQLDRELPAGGLAASSRLGFIQLLSAGLDTVDFAAIPPAITVAGNVGAYADPIAEHVMAMTLSLCKHLQAEHAALAKGQFRRGVPSRTLHGAVCGILGFGGIGQATARLMRPFGARIHAVNRSGQTTEPVDWIGRLDDLDQLLAAADVLVITIPLTAATRGLIGARELALMKPGAILVNVARGPIVDEQALYQHLVANPQFCAAIDAWWHEPSDGTGFRTDYPFFDLPNLLGSPHNSGDVAGVLQFAARRAAENTRRFLTGERVQGVASPADYAGLR
ncbi:MAG TPA: 2-hydroxyacid dehydrogenase [Streptosporangiaceae bacterium]|jgi:phosphoglycerate dehydrogenase-like enzyme|nr:2-hydroxyacid dehydrogenase [Streptosporangiaceae bacterium]